MSFDMDENELRAWIAEGEHGIARIWSAYSEACKARDAAEREVLELRQVICRMRDTSQNAFDVLAKEETILAGRYRLVFLALPMKAEPGKEG